MPIYEYRCRDCGRKFSLLVGMLAKQPALACAHCGGADVVRCVSRFSRIRSEDETIESLTDESVYGDVDADPRAMQRWARDMGAAMGDDLGEGLVQAAEEEIGGGAPGAPGDGDDD